LEINLKKSNGAYNRSWTDNLFLTMAPSTSFQL